MTRTCHPMLEEHAQYDRSNGRPLALSLSRSTQDSARSYPHSSHQACDASRENEGKPEPQRRRIAVACQRCRRRKIRCTGDSGNGIGCTNCRNAGVDSTTCQFLRVSSGTLDSIPAICGDYPYPLPGSSFVPPTTSSYMYNSGAGSVQPLGSSHYSRRGYAPQPFPYQNNTASHDYYGSYGMQALPDPMLEPQYGFHPNAQAGYMSCQENTQHSPAAYTTQDHLRQWSAAPSGGSRAYSQGFDQEQAGVRYPQPNLAFNSPTDPSVPIIDAGTPLVPVMGALAISHSSSSMLDDRTLPDPRAGMNGPEGRDSELSSSHETTRTSGSVDRLTTCSTNTQPSASTASSATGSIVSSSRPKSSSPSPRSSQDMGFNYSSAMSNQVVSTGPESTKSDFGMGQSNMVTSGIDDSMGYTVERHDPSRSLAQRSLYPYMMGNSGRRNGVPSPESTLLSGQAYEPFHQIRQPTAQLPSQPLGDGLLGDSGIVTARNTPRIPLTALGSNI